MSITGSNNPFACEPVVFANANSIISLGTITRDGNEFTFSVGFVWKINGVIYQNTAPVVLTIAEASTGFQRIDNALLNTSNTIELQQGNESDTIALKPIAPDTNIILTSWNISGTAIEDTETPIVGNQFVEKSDFNPYISNVTGTDAIIPLDPNGYSEIRLTNTGLISIAGYDLSLILGNANAKSPYPGKPFIILNLTGHDVVIKKELPTADCPFYFTEENDLVFPNNHYIYASFDPSGFRIIFKSWVDLSTKLDKSSTPSSVYTTDAQGLQVMKPISEFQPVGDYVTVNTTQTVTGNKTFNDVSLIKKINTSIYPTTSGGLFCIGGNGGYDNFNFLSIDGSKQDGFGVSEIYSNPEEGNYIRHDSLDGQVGSTLKINKYDTYLRNKYGGQNTSIYVDGKKKKIIIEGTQSKFAALGTSLITGTKNFEFPNNSGTLALLSDLSGFTTPSEVATQITTAINSNKTSFTYNILVSNWTLVSGKYEAVISNAGILANSFVDVIPSNDHVDIVRSAQIYPSVLISAGSVKVYSKFLPIDTITVTININ